MAAWAESALHPPVDLVTDGPASFAAAGAIVAGHGSIIVSLRKSGELEAFRRLNTFITNCKTGVRATYHHFSVDKNRRRYLAETEYRVNRRFDRHSLVGRPVHACAHAELCPERWLRLGDVTGVS